MLKYFALGFLFALVSCGGTNNTSTTDAGVDVIDETSAPDIKGQWIIENVVENDDSYVRPSELSPAATALINFNDNRSFGIITNCNHIAGTYSQSGDSVRMFDLSWTELACDDMRLEEMLKKVLPMVRVVDMVNDSIARLNSSEEASYIVLRKQVVKEK